MPRSTSRAPNDGATGVLTEDEDAVIYETHLGISPALGGALGIPHGKSFHFALNDSVYKDNRIPPMGFTSDAFGGKPVDSTRPEPRYADGQNWDVSTFSVPATTAKVVARLYYQTTSKEYVEFLHATNTTNTAGQTLLDAWNANGKSPPVLMAGDSTTITVGVEDGPADDRHRLSRGRNPFAGSLELRLSLARPAPVELAIYDALGRKVHTRRVGTLGAGAHRLLWDGRDDGGREAGVGVFWAQITAGDQMLRRKVIRLR